MTVTTNPSPQKDPFEIWLELVVLILVAPIVALIGGTWRLIKAAVRRFADARKEYRSRTDHTST